MAPSPLGPVPSNPGMARSSHLCSGGTLPAKQIITGSVNPVGQYPENGLTVTTGATFVLITGSSKSKGYAITTTHDDYYDKVLNVIY